MVARRTPIAVYASRPGQGLGVQEFTPGFPAAGLKTLEELARACQFDPSDDSSSYPDSFALWPGAGGSLVARIRDAGRDDYGRPHTLRIEGVWVDGTAPHDEILILLAKSTWPTENVSAETGLTYAELVPDGEIREALEQWRRRHGRNPRFIIGHSKLSVNSSELRIDSVSQPNHLDELAQATSPFRQFRAIGSKPPDYTPLDVPPLGNSTPHSRITVVVMTIALVALPGIYAWHWFKSVQKDRSIVELNQNLREKGAENEGIRSNLNRIREELTQERREKEAIRSELDKKQAEAKLMEQRLESGALPTKKEMLDKYDGRLNKVEEDVREIGERLKQILELLRSIKLKDGQSTKEPSTSPTNRGSGVKPKRP